MRKFIVAITLLAVIAGSQAGVVQDVAERLIPSFVTGYIINGEDATPHAAPYIVSLGSNPNNHQHSCGGSLISDEWIVTAAHCISTAKGMSVVAGLHQRSTFDVRSQARVVDYGKVHEQYGGNVGPYDIALLHVSQPFLLNEWVKTVQLPAADKLHAGTTQLYGWGQPKAYSFSPASTLQTVATDIVEWNACKAALPDTAPLAESNVCSDSHQSGISACNGDSGGPLVKESGSSAELVGIVSWGYIPCGKANLPSIYTRVSAYIDWIAQEQKTFKSL